MRTLHSALFFCGLFMLAPIATAQHVAADSHSQSMAGTDLEQIHGFMRKTWHSSEHPLRLGPTHIAGDFAVADWWHQGKGGRAVFKRSNQQWQLILCGGAGILQSTLWQQLGLTPSAAAEVVDALQHAEQSVSVADKALLDAFGATVTMQAEHARHPKSTSL
ncbi:copper uptake system-associated protein [Rheinheimera texasensis]|uniref:copper uptake system-associated protein n=1 Tax=Rheinheimera texasensis TaxID=306205 RepID=UPI0006899449|nr:copper uptake system-associated protein [Rheinheimera texasensis]